MIKDIEGLVNHITSEIKKNVDVAVLGMSGGADSTLTAILCKLALGEDSVYSVHMPMNKLDEQTFNSNSVDIAKKLGLKIINCPVNSISHAIIDSIEDALDTRLSTVNAGNARSRARMTVLYGIAHHLNDRLDGRVRVMGTGNCSEDQADYQTKGGDNTADLFVIGQLYKSEVYQLLDYFRDEGLISDSNINRTPSAGLWDGQSDEEELGYSYNEMEPFLRILLKMVEDSENLANFTAKFPKEDQEIATVVLARYYSGKHKCEAPPVVVGVRKFCD